MHKRLILAALASAFMMNVSAWQPTETTSATSFIQRGTAMLADRNFVGAANQFSSAAKQYISENQLEYDRFCLAIAELKQGNPEAYSLISDFIAEYPASPLRFYAKTALADCLYDSADWAGALEIYNDINPAVFDSPRAASMLYHRAFCRLVTGNYDSAESDYAAIAGSKVYGNSVKFYQGYIAYCRQNYNEALNLFKSVSPKQTGPTRMTDFYLSQIYYKKGDYNLAYSTAVRALKTENITDGFRAEAERVAGESAFNLDQDSKAVAHLRRYKKLTENPLPSALYVLGVSEYRDGNYSEAINTLTPVAKEDNAIGQSANLFIGQSSAKLGNYTAAMLAFDNACNMNFDDSVRETALYNYAVAKSEGGKIPFGSTVSAFESFLKQYPKSRYANDVEEYIITGYMTDNNYNAALNSINSIKNPSQNILRAKQQVLYTLGTKELAKGDHVGALNSFRQAKALGSLIPEVYRELDLWIAESLYKGKSYSGAASSYRSYLNSNRKGANIPAANYGLGYACFGDKKFSEAYSAFDAFLAKPGNASAGMIADALNRMGDCRYYASEFDRAAALYDKAFSTSPTTGDYALFQQAMMKGLRRQHSEKIAGMKNMMERFPTSSLVPQALLETGDAYNELGNTSDVIATYRELTSRYGSTAQGRQGELLLAITYLNNDRTNDAAETYRRIIRNYPTSDEARIAADDLKRIYADRGTLPEFISFMNSVPNSPEINPSEIDKLTYESAEKVYLTRNDISAVNKYLADYPKGENRAGALFYSAESARKQNRYTESLELVSELIENHPHWQGIDEAILMKAENETDLDMLPVALETFERLENSASSAMAVNNARLGIMKVARDLGEAQKALDAADKLLASSALESGEREDILFSRGVALEMLDRNDEAVAQWKELTSNTDNLYGTKATFYLANHYFNNSDLKNARKYAELLVNANTPHNYWLARTFILLSDINRSEGNTFEADEYLKSLKENYPGSEADIFTMIEQRLTK